MTKPKFKTSTALATSAFAEVRLHIEYVAPRRIWQKRRRTTQDHASHTRKLAAQIAKIGFNVPMLVDDDLAVVAGHSRLAAAELLELEVVPIIRIRHLTEEQIRLFGIFDNRIAQEVDFDEDALVLEFEELRLAEPEIEFSDSGFAIAEIDAMAGRARTKALNDLDSVALPKPAYVPITQPGDLWQCGPHRIICGNAVEPEVLERLLDGTKVRQHLSDPPFGLPTRAFSTTGKHTDFEMGAGEMSVPEFTAFLARYLEIARAHLVDGALCYAFMDFRHIDQLIAAGRQAGLSYIQLLVWVKDTEGLGSLYRSRHELVGVFRNGDAPHRNNNQLGKYGRNRSNVLSYPGVMGTGGGGKAALDLHPSVKNLAMIADLILDASAPGEAILDSFGGSGTTMIAAEKTDRRAFLCELSPTFVDITIRRFEALGRAKAILAGTDLTFEQIAAERGLTERKEG